VPAKLKAWIKNHSHQRKDKQCAQLSESPSGKDEVIYWNQLKAAKAISVHDKI
jgi:hypothetical protein